MRQVEKLTDIGFVDVHKVVYPEMHVSAYMYAERKGKNSVAFICYDEEAGEILVNCEYKPPEDVFITGAFGGSIDSDKMLDEIVVAETKEEAGFVVSREDVAYVGKQFVSTQMNQWCYLFLVFVNKKDQQEREPENAIEAMACTTWMKPDRVAILDDWKAICIVEKAKSKALI